MMLLGASGGCGTAYAAMNLANGADDVAGDDGAPLIESEKLFTEDIVEVGKTTGLYKFTVTATDLPAAATIYLTGDDQSFSLSTYEIPAGTSVTEIVLSINPVTIGQHKGGILFDFDNINPLYNRSYTYSVKAYDPDHLPVVNLSSNELSLEAVVGEKVEAELTLTPENCFDYIYAKAGTSQATGITISSTFFLYNMGGQKFRIAFQSKAEGEVEQTFTFTTTKGEPAVLTVKARGVGEKEPEAVEGDRLELDDTTPLSLYDHTFAAADMTNNKPLAAEGWTNVAEKGTRAWWGYTGTNNDGIVAAKATLYDSTVGEDASADASMLLVSPALDYKNANGKMLKFRLMGQFLHDGQEETLNVCLVEMVDGKPAIYPMNGFGIPATSEESGTWIPYEVDMSVVEEMPDVFFIGFRLEGKRGVASSATYYINDFSWGHKKVSDGISSVPVTTSVPAAVYNMQGVRVLDAATPEQIRTLPHGIYVWGGRKLFYLNLR